MKTCIREGCKLRADADGNTLCAKHATIEMFPAEPEQPPRKPAAIPEPKYRGPGSIKHALYAEDNSSFEGFEAQILLILQLHGECWVNTRTAVAQYVTNKMFERGDINPLPRRSGQKPGVAVFVLTPVGRTRLHDTR